MTCFALWPWRSFFFFFYLSSFLRLVILKNDLFCLMTLRNDLVFFMTLKKDLFCPRPMTLKNDLFCHMTLINDLFVLWSGRRTCFVLWPNMTILFIYWHALHALWHVSITYMYQNNKHTTTTFRSNSLVLTCRHVDTALQDNKELQKLLT